MKKDERKAKNDTDANPPRGDGEWARKNLFKIIFITSGNPQLCGARGILYLKEDHFFTFKAGLGVGTNNLAELYAMKLLLILALDKQITKIQDFGDSLLIINWITGKFRIHNLQLA